MNFTDRLANDFNDGTVNPSYICVDSNKYNLKDAVKLPPDEDPREWIANNLFNFHKQICMLFGTVNEFCTSTTCPKMTAGKKYEYLWSVGPQKEPYTCSAKDYIQHLLDWVQEQLDDSRVFPSVPGEEFPPDYMEICKTIARRLLRVYSHVYHHHSHEVRKLKEEAHMNTSLKHYIYFASEFDLVPPGELDPLKEYIENLT